MDEPASNPSIIATIKRIESATPHLLKNRNQPNPPTKEHKNKPSFMEVPRDNPKEYQVCLKEMDRVSEFANLVH